MPADWATMTDSFFPKKNTSTCTPQSLERASRACRPPCPSSRKGADVTVIEAAARALPGRELLCGRRSRRPCTRADRTSGRDVLRASKALASNTSELVYGSGAAVRHPSFISAMTACREPARCEARDALAAELSEASTSMLRAEAQEHGFILQESAGTIIVSPEAGEASPATLEDVTAIEPSLYAATDVGSFSILARDHLVR